MLPRHHRLRLEKDFKRAFEQGKGFSSPFFVLKSLNKADFSDSDASQYSRFGFVVSKKVQRFAIGRNRLKRKMREGVRLLLKNSSVKPNFDIVLVAKEASVGKTYDELERDISILFKKAGLV